jgi:DNA-binding PadR family transcriptional regulator
MLKLIIVNGRMMSLEKKGLIGSIDDEHGEEVFFTTENGRELLKKMENI